MEEKQSKKKEDYIKELYKRTWEDLRTTHQRFDYLLITIDGAGIYLSLELMKFLYEHHKPINVSLKAFGMCLAISIIFNFISQFCSFNICRNVLKIEEDLAFYEEPEIKKYNEKVQIFTFFASFSMLISMILMIIGVIGLIIFLYKNF
ncbi:hypothetical protein C8C83_0431 [Flavobacterium sp. 90]|uniref:hypothetical protein n=1 Tax=unclassified Flavobacterium TaxID=196869 RepID=UPI000EB1F32A|nr:MULTISPECIES: hypothetical protein [unclassified Flavobacterium]RKR08838.1 hypothetical protein C8C82_0726 [Flavobacterium sp. 81]TCK52625.1 hypothetical protein C8C83_0431 [Flavobacterium sp. 90]